MLNLENKIVASLEVDPQKTFTPLCQELSVKGGDEIAESLNEQAKVADLRAVSKDSHARGAVWITENMDEVATPLEGNYPHADLKWMPHAIVGTEGWELIPGLPPITDYNLVIYKGLEPELHPYGACYHTQDMTVSTGLIEFFIAEGVDIVIVGGLAMDYCVMQTIRELVASAKFDVVLNLSATRAVTEEGYESVLNEINDMRNDGYRVNVIETLDDLKSIDL